MDLIQKLFEKELFSIYPEPIVFKFLRAGVKLLNKIQLKNLFEFLEEILPEFNTSILIDGNDIRIVILLQKI
ncbi:unnamed protein product, partial [marine sediment metagenome]